MNPLKLKRFVVTGGAAVSLFMLFMLFSWYGSYRVPVGMDTMPDHPPGTFCLIQKHPRTAKVGSVVLIRTSDGGSLLSRVRAVHEHGVVVQHDNADSVFRLLQGDTLGVVPWAQVHGLVLIAMPPDPDPVMPGSPRGR